MSTSGRSRKASTEAPAEPGSVSQDEQELREEIAQTRERVGETVEQLVAKTDVKGRARAKAAELTSRAKGGTAQMRAKAAGTGAGMRSQVTGEAATARQKAAAIGGTAKAQLQARSAPVWQAAPDPVRRTVKKGAGTARQRPMPLAVAVVALTAGYLVLRWWRRR